MQLEFKATSAAHLTARTGAALALRSISFSVRAGEPVAIVGPSGSGKTTLLYLAAAAMRPQAGSLSLSALDPWQQTSRGLRDLRRKIFLAPQTPPLPPRQRVVTAVLAGRLPVQSFFASLRSLFYPTDLPAAHAALSKFGVGDKLFHRVDRLSGGERQRVALARGLLSPASLWLIDEPLSALDPTRAEQALRTLVEAARERRATLVTSLHQVDMALKYFPRIIGLREGQLVFDLPRIKVTDGLLADLYANEVAAAPQPEEAGATAPAVMHCR